MKQHEAEEVITLAVTKGLSKSQRKRLFNNLVNGHSVCAGQLSQRFHDPRTDSFSICVLACTTKPARIMATPVVVPLKWEQTQINLLTATAYIGPGKSRDFHSYEHLFAYDAAVSKLSRSQIRDVLLRVLC